MDRDTIKVIVNGATGRQGRILCQKIKEDPEYTLVAACSKRAESPSISEIQEPADVIIDFSNHEATKELTEYAAQRKIPVVIATTGRTAEEEDMVHACARQVPVFSSANMSVGIAKMCQIAKDVIKTFPSAEVEIIECHHNRKVDVPSGTALMCANTIRQERPESELVIGRHENGRRNPTDIGIHSLRYGNESGTHRIIFSCGNETLELCHRAEDVALFTDGALAAAKFLMEQPAGLYGMKDMLEVSH